MCISATTALQLAAMAGGTLLQHKAQQDALDEQHRIASQEAMRQLGYQDQASQEVLKHLDETYDPMTREAAQEDIAGEREQYIKEHLAPDEDYMGKQVVGKVSNEYLGARAQAVSDELKRTAELAKLLGKTQAPTYLRQNEAIAAGDLATQLGMTGGEARGSSRVAALQAGGVRPNAFQSGLGSAMAGAAPYLSMPGSSTGYNPYAGSPLKGIQPTLYPKAPKLR